MDDCDGGFHDGHCCGDEGFYGGVCGVGNFGETVIVNQPGMFEETVVIDQPGMLGGPTIIYDQPGFYPEMGFCEGYYGGYYDPHHYHHHYHHHHHHEYPVQQPIIIRQQPPIIQQTPTMITHSVNTQYPQIQFASTQSQPMSNSPNYMTQLQQLSDPFPTQQSYTTQTQQKPLSHSTTTLYQRQKSLQQQISQQLEPNKRLFTTSIQQPAPHALSSRLSNTNQIQQSHPTSQKIGPYFKGTKYSQTRSFSDEDFVAGFGTHKLALISIGHNDKIITGISAKYYIPEQNISVQGPDRFGSQHGIGTKLESVYLAPDEYIVEVNGYSGYYIYGLGFTTSKGRKVFFGSQDGIYFNFKAPSGTEFSTLQGGVSEYLDYIDFKVSPIVVIKRQQQL